MSIRGWLGAAGVGAGLVCVSILALAVPNFLWTDDCIVAAGILFLSFASPALFPAPMPAGSKTDAPAIWLIGPLGKLWILLFVLSVSALRLGLIGWHTASWVASILWLGSIVVGFAVLQAATRVVALAANQTRSAADDPRTQWAATLRKYSMQTDQGDGQRLLNGLAERMQYAANEQAGQHASENHAISSLLEQLGTVLAKPEELPKLIRSTEALLEQRELSLRASRSRA